MMDKRGWRREQALLLLCTQAPFDDDRRAQFDALLEDPVDWEYLVQTSYGHAVTPLLCRTLGLVSPSRVPPDVLAATQPHLDDNRSRNDELTQELLRILDALDRSGIPAIPFKGPVLAEIYYGDPGFRRYADLDFLVAEDAARETVKVLHALGYPGTGQVSSRDKAFVPSPRQDAAIWRYAGEYLFLHDEKPYAVEPHWAFAPPTLGLDLDYGLLWARARRGVLAGQAILTLGPEDTLLSLALHGAKSHWTRLIWIADLDRALKRETSVDWPALLAEARRMGVLRILLVGLQLVRLHFKTGLDSHVSAAIDKDPVARQLAAERSAALFAEHTSYPSSAALSRDWRRMRERRRDRLAYILRTVFTPRVQHFEALPLPDSLYFAYYAFKPAHDYIALPLWLAAKKLGLLGRTP